MSSLDNSLGSGRAVPLPQKKTWRVPTASFPLGATVLPGGVNFSVYSRNASGVELLLVDREDDAPPARVIAVDPLANRTSHYWHVFVRGIRAGQLYGYRVHGPFDAANGMRFDGTKVLLDPYGRCVADPKNYSRGAASLKGDNAYTSMTSVVVDPRAYDWEGDKPLHRPSSQTIIYEMHVGGFTRHPNSGVSEKKRGKYPGLIEKLPYLQELGITAVELLPVFQFDRSGCTARGRQLLGICVGLVLRPAPGIQFKPRSACTYKRIS